MSLGPSIDTRCSSKDAMSITNVARIPLPTASVVTACPPNKRHASIPDHISALDSSPVPWRPAPFIGGLRPFDPADVVHRPSSAAHDAVAPTEASLGFADPFHYDWPYW
jgi:hypothetical protein